jgi:hypothetical protein
MQKVFCKYYNVWVIPNIYNNYVENPDNCKRKNDKIRTYCLFCAQYINSPKSR